MRRKQQRQNSLELFLDAICNMFGAFLFLLLFVVVLLQTTRRELAESRTQHVSYNELRALTMERDALKEEWRDALQQSRDLASLQEQILAPEIAAIIQETLQIVQKQQETEQKNAVLQAEIDSRNAEIDATSQDKARLQAEIDAKQLRLKELEDEAQTRKKAQTRKTSPPQLHFSDKEEFPVVVKYGRLYCWKRLKDQGAFSELEFNDDEFYVVERDAAGAIVAPKPSAGVDLNDETNNVCEALRARFANVSARRFKIAFVVSADSFAEFNVARNFFKDNDYDVRILVGERGERIFDRGSVNAEAQ